MTVIYIYIHIHPSLFGLEIWSSIFAYVWHSHVFTLGTYMLYGYMDIRICVCVCVIVHVRQRLLQSLSQQALSFCTQVYTGTCNGGDFQFNLNGLSRSHCDVVRMMIGGDHYPITMAVCKVR